MNRESERALLGTRLEHRPDQARQLQERLSAADASLPQDVRARHPTSPLGQIEQDHRERWLALLPTEVTQGLGIAAGRVLAEADDRTAVSEQIAAIKRKHPQLRSLFAYRAGSSTSGRAARHG
jgi:hypothetical protein